MACVEDAYVTVERQTLKAGGKLVVVADAPAAVAGKSSRWTRRENPPKWFA